MVKDRGLFTPLLHVIVSGTVSTKVDKKHGTVMLCVGFHSRPFECTGSSNLVP